jgi:hypothetical protein
LSTLWAQVGLIVSPEPSEPVGLGGLFNLGIDWEVSGARLLNLSLILGWFGLDHSTALSYNSLAVVWLSLITMGVLFEFEEELESPVLLKSEM